MFSDSEVLTHPFSFCRDIACPIAVSPDPLSGVAESCSLGKASSICLMVLLGLGVQILLQRDAKLLAERLELVEVLLVLFLVLNLGLDSCEGRQHV